MDNKYLIINTGSASKKYALYEGEVELLKVHIEEEDNRLIATIKARSAEEKLVITQAQYDSSVSYLLELLLVKNLISDYSDLTAIGLRIVAPGIYFLANKFIDAEYLSQLDSAREEAPLHIEPIIAEIRQIRTVLPEIDIIGISDSLFHATMPDVARFYSLPRDIVGKYQLQRYGYHGISTSSVLRKLEATGSVPGRIIVCHLGGGVSITAVKDGRSIEVSMGFSPLEGVVMATRIGNIDASAVIYLAEKLGMSLNELETFLNTKCGLLGLSGKTSDVRELIELEKQSDPDAKLALDVFAYQVKKYVGAYVAVLGGLDLLVFTATIGERSPVMRARICKGMESLGIIFDEAKNSATVSTDGFINGDTSRVRIAVITTDEMKEIAKETFALI